MTRTRSEASVRTASQILDSYLDEYGLLSHQLRTYDHFITFDIAEILRNESGARVSRPDGTRYHLDFSNPYVAAPSCVTADRRTAPVLPAECRLNDATYESPLYVDVTETTVTETGNVKTVTHQRVVLAKIPTMVKSRACNLRGMDAARLAAAGEDPECAGGYFIVHGKERIVVGQVRQAYNIPVTFWKNGDLYCEMRSMSEETAHSVLVAFRVTSSSNVLVTVPGFREPFPLAVLLRASGLDPSEFSRHSSRLAVRMSLDAHGIDERTAVAYLESLLVSTSGKTSDIRTVLGVEMFPHLGVASTPVERRETIRLMTGVLLATHSGTLTVTDRDSYANKRVEFCGVLCSELFRMLYKKFLKSLNQQLEKKCKIDLTYLQKNAGISSGLLYSFATGNWGVQRNNYIRNGVCQIPHPKVCQVSVLSTMRRMINPSGKEGKNTKMRQLNPSSMFFACPFETPEGQSVGVVLNMALTCTVSMSHPTTIVRRIVSSLLTGDGPCSVFVNSVFCGKCDAGVTERISEARRSGALPRDVTFAASDSTVNVYCDAGRLIRPLVVSERAHLGYSFRDGSVEFACPASAQTCDLSMYGDGKYSEIDPCAMMGVVALQIPFPEHTQSPRLCYQSSMMKQAIGLDPYQRSKMETVTYENYSVQRSLSEVSLAGRTCPPNGTNAIVAIACYYGMNQEDSVIINRSAVQRGLFLTGSFKTLTCEEKKFGSSFDERICLPPYELRKFHYNYSLLDERGIVRLGSTVTQDDIIVGKVVTRSHRKESNKYDDSVYVKSGEEGVVTRVHVTDRSGGMLVKIVVARLRFPEIGDKFCSAMAQKGTCGMMYNQEDMPFTASGMVPDIIINPHCIPSRMTINQIMGCVMGKARCLDPESVRGIDPLAFRNTSERSRMEQLCDALKRCGMSPSGAERMYNGATGRAMDCEIFVGPTYYHRLKHLVADKIHARADGRYTQGEHQPICGRRQNGGQRVGEMEKDGLLVHGGTMMLHERMFTCSDRFQADVCDACGTFSNDDTVCHSCGERRVERVNLPYAAKILLQEQSAMLIKTFVSWRRRTQRNR